MNCSSKLLNQRTRSLEPLIYNLGLRLLSEISGAGNLVGTQPLTCELSVSGQMVSELSQIVGHPAGVTEDSLVWGKKHIYIQ